MSAKRVRQRLRLSTSSSAGFPARESRRRGRARGSPTTEAASGESTLELFASFDPATSSWRTVPTSSRAGSTKSSRTWSRSGIALSGSAFRRPPSVPRTGETASGLLPTPTATAYGTSQNGVNSSRPSAKTPSLWTLAREGMLPTPTASDARRSGSRTNPASNAHTGTSLTDALVRNRLPTPQARDWKGGGKDCLPTAVGDTGSRSRRLNPRFVEWMMGFPLGWTDLSGDDADEKTNA